MKLRLLSLTGTFLIGLLTGGCAEDVLTSVGTVTEEFLQNSAAEIDVLWVVDNSESMAEEQAGLGLSFQGFIDNLVVSEVEYQIGVISTDINDGGLLHTGASNTSIIDSTTADAVGVFLENINVGTDGSRIERAFESTALAIGQGIGWQPDDPPSPPNPGFLRDEAALFIIMVSDEDDKSFGPVGYYNRLFESYHGAGNEARISVSTVVGPPTEGDVDGGCVDSERGAAQPGDRYVELADMAGGIYTSICGDFNEALRNLSLTAAGLSSIFELSSYPSSDALVRECGELEASTLCVRVNTEPVAESETDGWTYDEEINAIIFGVNAIPPPQATITVEYRR